MKARSVRHEYLPFPKGAVVAMYQFEPFTMPDDGYMLTLFDEENKPTTVGFYVRKGEGLDLDLELVGTREVS